MARRPLPLPLATEVALKEDSRLVSLLEDIEQEEVPERLLALARELQRQLSRARQRQKPN